MPGPIRRTFRWFSVCLAAMALFITGFALSPPAVAAMTVLQLWINHTPQEEEHVNDFIDAQRAELTYKGAWWALPYDYSVIGLFYAKHLFDKAGVGYPNESWTWTDLARTARKLTVTTGDGKVNQWGMLSLWGYMSQWFEGFIMTHGGRVFNEDYTRAVVNNPDAVRALRVPYALINEVQGAPKPSKLDIWGSFLKGLGAMTLAGSWDTLTIRNSVEFDFDVAMLPKADNQQRVVSATGGAWAMSTASKYQDQAWELIKFLASPLVARKLIVEPTRSLPPRKSLMRPWAERIVSTGDAPAHAFALGDQAMRFGRNVPVLDFNAGSIYSKYGSALFEGSVSPEEVAIRMEYDLNVEFDRLKGK